MNRTHRRTAVLLAAVLVAVPAAALSGAGHQALAEVSGATPDGEASGAPAGRVAAEEAEFPRPGGGPVAIHTLNDGQVYLLDERRGTYRRLPYYGLVLSPDRRTVVVEHPDGRLGIADRAGLLAAGDRAVRWTSLPVAHPVWSPDGRAVLTTTFDKDTGTFTAHRYDLATGRVRHTPVTADCDTCTVGWAADSRRYVVMQRHSDPEVPSGPARYLNPDGTLGAALGVDGMIWGAGAYSPSGRYVIAEPPRPFPDPEPTGWMLPRILDLRTGEVVRVLTTRFPVLGWYDDRHVVTFRLTGEQETPVLQVVDVLTGQVRKSFDAPGLPQWSVIQTGSSAGLRGDAATLGF